MNRRRFQQLFLSLGMTGLCACTGMQQAKANSDFEGVVWKNFEYKALGKIVRFEFPMGVSGTTTFEFNPAFSDSNQLIIALRTNENIGWVHASSGVNIFISVGRYRGINPNGSWAPYYEFSTMQDAYDRITKERGESSNRIYTRNHSLIKIGASQWLRTIQFGAETGSHEKDVYRAILSRDYLISISFNLGTRGKPDEIRLAELRKVGERIVASVRIE